MTQPARTTVASLPHRSATFGFGAAFSLLVVSGLATTTRAQLVEELEKIPNRPSVEPISPATPDAANQPVPGLTGGQNWFERVSGENLSVQTASKLAEGTFIIRRPGTLVTVPSGHRVWVPETKTRAPGEGAMLLIPCQTLARMDTALSSIPGQTILISGEIFVYHGQNYLLPTAFARAPATPPTPTEPAAEDTPQTQPTDSDQHADAISDNPEIDELMKNLDSSLSMRGLAVPVLDPGADARTQSHALAAGVIPEGGYLARRLGRLIRGESGAWTVTFDNDSMDAAESRPMIVVPCRLLMRLESRAQRRGDQLALTISGRVYAYGDTNYLVPTLMQEIANSGIGAQQ